MNDSNVFLDKARPPTSREFAAALKSRAGLWRELKDHVASPVVEDWKYYGKKYGWTLKLLVGKRNLCFMTARDGHFVIAFVFGDKAVQAASESRLPKALVQQLLDAKKYMEGRGIRIDVKSRVDLENAKILLDIKQSA